MDVAPFTDIGGGTVIHATTLTVTLILLTATLSGARVPVQVTDDGHLNYQPSLIQKQDGDLMIAVGAGIGYVWGATCIRWGEGDV